MHGKPVAKVADIDRLGDGVVMVVFACACHGAIADIGGQHDKRGGLAGLAQLRHKLPAAHAGHGNIDEEKIRLYAFDERQAFRPALGRQHHKIER